MKQTWFSYRVPLKQRQNECPIYHLNIDNCNILRSWRINGLPKLPKYSFTNHKSYFTRMMNIYTITENWRHGNINFDVHPQKAFNRRRQKVFYITVFSALNDRCSFKKYLILKKRCSMILTLSTFVKNRSTTQCIDRYKISIFATIM